MKWGIITLIWNGGLGELFPQQKVRNLTLKFVHFLHFLWILVRIGPDDDISVSCCNIAVAKDTWGPTPSYVDTGVSMSQILSLTWTTLYTLPPLTLSVPHFVSLTKMSLPKRSLISQPRLHQSAWNVAWLFGHISDRFSPILREIVALVICTSF